MTDIVLRTRLTDLADLIDEALNSEIDRQYLIEAAVSDLRAIADGHGAQEVVALLANPVS